MMCPSLNELAKEPQSSSEILRRCVRLVCDNLPEQWSAEPTYDVSLERRGQVDAAVRLSSPDGVEGTLVFEAKRSLDRRDISAVVAMLEDRIEAFPNAVGVVAARYLAPTVREALAKRGFSYVDATGNSRLVMSRPGLFVYDRGTDQDPWRGPGRPRGTLKGAPAAKVVRALADFRGPWRIRELIDISGASTGATYRVVDYLEREGLLERDEAGNLVLKGWRALIQAWSSDYGFVRSNHVTRYIEPRGLQALMDKARSSEDLKYAVTGSLAAAEWAPYAPPRAAQIYVENAAETALRWGLRPADAGANVLLAEPETDVVFDRTVTTSQGVLIVTPSQAAVDLLTGPGRNPSEAEELMDWMEQNEPSWRL